MSNVKPFPSNPIMQSLSRFEFRNERARIATYKLMVLVLSSEFSEYQILAAIENFRQRSETSPLQCDIFNILVRGDKPRLQEEIYADLTQRLPGTLTADELEYISDYEYNAITGKYK